MEKVVYADFFPSYGNLLILEHGGGYHSLYGHCAEFLVRNGDFVGPGTPPAVAGDTASLGDFPLFRDPLPDQARQSLALASAKVIGFLLTEPTTPMKLPPPPDPCFLWPGGRGLFLLLWVRPPCSPRNFLRW